MPHIGSLLLFLKWKFCQDVRDAVRAFNSFILEANSRYRHRITGICLWHFLIDLQEANREVIGLGEGSTSSQSSASIGEGSTLHFANADTIGFGTSFVSVFGEPYPKPEDTGSGVEGTVDS